jgi:hypothetical protein
MEPQEQMETRQEPTFEDRIPDIVQADSEQHALRYAQMGADADVLSFMMKIEIPPEFRGEFEQFRPLLTRRLMLANIKREDVKHFKTCFSLIVDYYRIGLPEEARSIIRETLCELMLTSSVNGFQVRQANTRRSEHSIEGMRNREPGQEEKKKRRFGFFRRG